MVENNSSTRQVYGAQMMAQQAQALDALQKIAQLKQGMDPSHPNGNSEGSMPDLVVGQTEVYVVREALLSNTNSAHKLGRV
jgi:phosphoglycerate-specific signal transduction histidine kinase